MESLRAFTKGNRFLDMLQRANGAVLQETQEEDEDFKLSLERNPDINDDAYLFHILNQFVTLFNKRDKVELMDDTEDERKIWDDKIQTVLRYGLLRYLRQWDHKCMTQSLREVLNHWWVTILNNLQLTRVHATRLEIPLLTTLMECLARIMNLLICLPKNDEDFIEQDLNIYCNYLLLTCHYITSQLNRNSKSNFTYQYIKQYNDLLHAQLGLINALAFIFLPDTLEYNILVIRLLTKGKFKISSEYKDALFPWKTQMVKRTRNFPRVKYNAPHTHNAKCFNIIISYLQEEKTFLSFTWHYWRLILLFCEEAKLVLNQNNLYSLVYGSEIIIHFTINKTFQQDIAKFNKISRQMNSSGSKPSNGSTANIQLDKLDNYHKTNKAMLEFIDTRFQMLRLWKEPLYQLFIEVGGSQMICSILLQYDKKQLNQLNGISLYETQLTNLIFNKYLTGIILDQYDNGEIINWNSWTQIIIHSLKTLSFEIQINILKFLFNMWKYIPIDMQMKIIKEIITLNDSTNFQYSQTLILINKLIVFRFLPNKTNKSLIISYLVKLQNIYDQLLEHNESKSHDFEKSNHTDSLLLFDNNRKYVLTHTKIRHHYRKNPYISIDKEFVESNESKLEGDEGRTDTKVSEFSYKIIPIFKNVMMPYNKNQQHYIEKYNNKWKNISNHETSINNTPVQEEVSVTRLQFDLSTYRIDIESVNTTPSISTKINEMNTLMQLNNFIKTFNLTMIEYYEFMNLYSEDYIRIEV